MATEELVCRLCGRVGGTEELAAGWVTSRPPRPVGSTEPREDAGPDAGTRALCPDCARRHLRDLEARLDP